MTIKDDANNSRYAEFRARARREQIVTMAKRVIVLQHGHFGGLIVDESDLETQREVYRKMGQLALVAAEAFMDEADKFLAPQENK